MEKPKKLSWSGKILAIQPRIRLMRSFDQRNHAYLGYALRLKGKIDNEERKFIIGIGKGAQAKHEFRVGYQVSGECEPVADPKTESVEYYKVSRLKVIGKTLVSQSPPPWLDAPLTLETYRARGHRRLDPKTYEIGCRTCIWGCRMAVEMIIDQWNPKTKRYRYETFCYGPKSCSLYNAGPTRKVPGRKGMSWDEPDSVDVEATEHRGRDE